MTTKTADGWLDYFHFIGFDNHEEPARFATWLNKLGYSTDQIESEGINALAEKEQEHFLGEYDNPIEYVEMTVNEGYSYELEALPSWIRDCIDYSEIWRRMLSFEIMDNETPNGNVWLWHQH